MHNDITNEYLESIGFDKLRRFYLSSSFVEYPQENRPKLTAITNEEFELSRSGLASFHFKLKSREQLKILLEIFNQ